MFLIVHKYEIILRCRVEAGYAGHLGVSIANEAGLNCGRDLAQRALHGSQCIAAEREEESLDVRSELFARTRSSAAGRLALAHDERSLLRSRAVGIPSGVQSPCPDHNAVAECAGRGGCAIR